MSNPLPSNTDPRGAGSARPDAARRRLRVAILADMLEEQWPSMDLVADSLLRELPRQTAWPVAPLLVRPPLVRLLGRVVRGNGHAAPTVDRVFNRFWIYPRTLDRHADGCELFHIVDHSYAHLALSLPAGRVVTTCHDIDTFRGFLSPGRIDTALPRFLVNRLAAGLRASAVVVCPSRCTAAELVEAGLVAPERVQVVANGVEPPAADAAADHEAARLLATARPTVDILHVGSTIARKRIDLLLEIVARVAANVPGVRLVRVGGEFTRSQTALLRQLGLAGRVLVLPFLDRATLHAVYRRVALLAITSEREGFGLPIIEALAAGIPVVARDLPVFREVAGDAATFVESTDPADWAGTIERLLTEAREEDGLRGARIAAGRSRAGQFSWTQYAAEMAWIYARTADALAAAGEDTPNS